MTIFPQKLPLPANPETAPLASSSNGHTTHTLSTPRKRTHEPSVGTCPAVRLAPVDTRVPRCHEGSDGVSLLGWWGDRGNNEEARLAGFAFVPRAIGALYVLYSEILEDNDESMYKFLPIVVFYMYVNCFLHRISHCA